MGACRRSCSGKGGAAPAGAAGADAESADRNEFDAFGLVKACRRGLALAQRQRPPVPAVQLKQVEGLEGFVGGMNAARSNKGRHIGPQFVPLGEDACISERPSMTVTLKRWLESR